MAIIPTATQKRLSAAVPKFRKVLELARKRDVNESDTVTIVTDILEEVFGFDKYSEITREYSIKGTFCDLAISTSKKIEYLIEVKAIGTDLKDNHLRQAVTYASQEGIRWVVITNGIMWEVHRVKVDNRVENTKLIGFDFTKLNPRKNEDQEILFLLCKRGVQKDVIDEFYEYRQSVNRYSVAAVIMSDPIIGAVRRELRRIKSGLKVTDKNIEDLIKEEVLKRDLIENESTKEATKRIRKALKKVATTKSSKASSKSTGKSNESNNVDAFKAFTN